RAAISSATEDAAAISGQALLLAFERLRPEAPFAEAAARRRLFGTRAFASSSGSSSPSTLHALPQAIHRVAPPRADTTSPSHCGQFSPVGSSWGAEASPFTGLVYLHSG